MVILAIESSCDETAAAVVEKKENEHLVQVLSDVKATSQEMHEKTGGIVPEVAAREQIVSILPVIDSALREARLKADDLDAIAVTVGPGLIGSLLIGVETARVLSFSWRKPIIPVNHLLAHLYSNWISNINNKSKDKKKIPQFPAVGLVVSGGHTELVLMKNYRELKQLGSTRDDAAGECFDKCARVILGVPYPGGPAIEATALKFMKDKKRKIRLPRPMSDKETFDMSFSGLKTAVIREVNKVENLNANSFEICSELQEAIVDVLSKRVAMAFEKFNPKSLLVGGGVAANKRLREVLKDACDSYGVELFVPELKYCMDNAAMVGAAAFFYSPTSYSKTRTDPILEIV